jgi:hypothetical protein
VLFGAYSGLNTGGENIGLGTGAPGFRKRLGCTLPAGAPFRAKQCKLDGLWKKLYRVYRVAGQQLNLPDDPQEILILLQVKAPCAITDKYVQHV